jgi:hypothetical protein
MLSGKKWQGELLIQPKEMSLYAGESTGPAPKLDKVVLAQ